MSMQEISQETIIKASEGDIGSFEEIYRTYSGFVYNVSLRVVRNQEAAQEVTQDVFLSVYHKLAGFKFESTLKTWLYRIAVNTAINYAKKISKEQDRMVSYEYNTVPIENTKGFHVGIDKEYNEDLINRLLDSLNPQQRACIVLRNIEGLSYEQIAQTLKININTVRSRLKRAREKLISLRKEVITHGV